jgi:hypothetical protein
MGDIERSIADDQEVDDKELKKAAGGAIIFGNWCWGEEYSCKISTNTSNTPKGYSN